MWRRWLDAALDAVQAGGMRRLLGGAVVMALALLVGACSTSEADREHCGKNASCNTTPPDVAATTSTTDGTLPAPAEPRTVTESGLTFTVPALLRYRTDGFTSSGEAADGFYANFPFGKGACDSRCGIISFTPLPPNGVVLSIGSLSGVGVGGHNPGDPAPNTTIAGRDAAYTTDTSCGDEAITVRFPAADEQDVIIRACLSGPDLGPAEEAIRTMLATATSTGS
jgi:hypothetical protein